MLPKPPDADASAGPLLELKRGPGMHNVGTSARLQRRQASAFSGLGLRVSEFGVGFRVSLFRAFT